MKEELYLLKYSNLISKYEAGYSVTQISKEEGRNVGRTIQRLKELNLIDEEKRKIAMKDVLQLKYADVIERYEAGDSIGMLFKIEKNFYNVMEELKKYGLVNDKKREKALEEKEIKKLLSRYTGVKEKYELRYEQKQIAQEEGISDATVCNALKKLRKYGLIDEKKREEVLEKNKKEEAKLIEKARISERVKRKYRLGFLQSQIAQEEGISESTVSVILRKTKEAQKVELEARVKQKIDAKYTQTQIAQEEGLSNSTICRIVDRIRTKKDETKKFIILCRQKQKEGELEEKDIKKMEDGMKEYITDMPIKDIIFLINVYNANRQYCKAIEFIEFINGCENINQEEKDKLNVVKGKIEKYIEKRKVISLLKAEQQVNEIKKVVNLSETEILEIKRKMKFKARVSKPEGPSID